MELRGSRLFLMAPLCAAALIAQPIRSHPANPHYYLFDGRPTILITSAEHYGAIVNKAFDYVPYLHTLRKYGLNYTRIYPGAMFEPMGKFMTGNTLGPKPRDLIVPWARSSQPGYLAGGNKFDLDRWNTAYFDRLKDFLAKAAERGIVVEICFFNSQYSDTWPISPLYCENNIQGAGKRGWRDAQTMKDPDLLRREEDYVRKITREVNAFDNVVLEICDEAAGIGTGVALAGRWVSHLLGVVRTTESTLPKKHLVAQEMEGPYGGAMDFSPDPRLSLITAQYVWGGEPNEQGGDWGGMRALDYKYDLNKPIEMNETDYYPLGYRGDKIADSRVEAWEFLVGGGSGFNQLNGLYTPEDPAGNKPDNQQLLTALQALKQFLYSFDFLKMHRDKTLVAGGLSAAGTYSRAISEPGKQYALYIHHSREKRGSYTAAPGEYHESLTLSLPAGQYEAQWVKPSTGAVAGRERFTHTGGNRSLSAPLYTVDIALAIRAK